ncbi:MAG: hypothetical protein KF865_05320 [Bdellovibrionaceae bacterium]|nr:hypothetical protein [Pseudobdellovibrionaceae bacterium]
MPKMKGIPEEAVLALVLSTGLLAHTSDIYVTPSAWVVWTAVWLMSLSLAARADALAARLGLTSLFALQVFYIAWYFPDITNHEVVLFVLEISFLWDVSRSVHRTDAVDRLRRRLPVVIGAMYLWAGFHKLNPDFFFAPFSCMNAMWARLPLPPLPSFLLPGTAALVAGGEILLGALLLLNRARGPVLLLAFLFHSALLLADFGPFTIPLYAFLILLLPESVRRRWLETTAKRDVLFFALLSAAGLFIFEWWRTVPALPWRFVPVFTGSLPAFLSVVRCWRPAAPERPPGPTRLSAAVLGSLMFLWGFQPYIGLRTNGVFNMYSNLLTENDRGNHVLVPSSWARLFPYQHDLVRADFEIWPRSWELQRLNHKWVPRLELLKQIRKHRDKEGPLAGRLTGPLWEKGFLDSHDIAREPSLEKAGDRWLLPWLQFRATASNQCEW